MAKDEAKVTKEKVSKLFNVLKNKIYLHFVRNARELDKRVDETIYLYIG